MRTRPARPHAATRTAAAVAAAAGAFAALTGCDSAPPTAVPAAPIPTATSATPAATSTPPPAPPSPAAPARTANTPSARAGHSGPAPLQALLDAGHPAGSGPEVALRFLQALQRGDDLAAARELFAPDRDHLARSGPGTLHRVLRDVAANAGLPGAGPCTRAARNDAQSAVVTCGRHKVVVHVLDRVGLGVQISARHPDGDDYPGEHTHAYTRIRLG